MSSARSVPTRVGGAPALQQVVLTIESSAAALWDRVEVSLDALVGVANPLRHLGSLAFLCFWLLALSGIYLFAVIDTSVDDAWRSIDDLTRDSWWLGGWIRSLHRYAADAFVLFTAAHVLRELVHGRYRHFRRFSWLTGVAVLPLITVSAIGGFWLNWDQLGQYSATASAELLDWWPIFASPFARNFAVASAVSDRLFSLLVFVHLGVPLLLLFALWFHVQRIARAAVFPPRLVSVLALWGLLSLALLQPVQSHAAADLSLVPRALALDWWLLFVHPLTEVTSPGFIWLLAGTLILGLCALPFIPMSPRTTVAVVDPANCSGCRLCVEDCPYTAITMQPHPLLRGRELALVDADLCAGCGICSGACPSSTPFRSVAELRTGIDMPQLPVAQVLRDLQQGLAGTSDGSRIVVFGCDHGADVTRLAGPDCVSLPLLCTAMLPPAFIEQALRDGAQGVVVVSCAEGRCEFRLGPRWINERVSGERAPHLRASVPRERVVQVAAGRGELSQVIDALSALRQRIDPAHAAKDSAA